MKNLLLYADFIGRHHQLLPFSEEEFEELYNRNIDTINYNLSDNPYTPINIIKSLYKRNNYIGKNSNIPIEMFWEFYYKKDRWINRSLVCNQFTPKEILKELYDVHNDDYVIICLSSNPNTPIDVLQDIFLRGYHHKHLAKNPNLPNGIINVLYHKNDKNINVNLFTNPNLPISMIRKKYNNGKFNYEWVSNPNIPQDILLDIYNKYNKEQGPCAHLAQNHSLSIDLMKKLANIDDEIVICNLVANKNVPTYIKQSIIDKIIKIKIFE